MSKKILTVSSFGSAIIFSDLLEAGRILKGGVNSSINAYNNNPSNIIHIIHITHKDQDLKKLDKYYYQMVNMSDSDPKVYFGNSETVYLLNLKHHVVNEIENEDGFVLLP